jgi:tocopherol cyclase
MFANKLTAFFNPEQFQGWGKTTNYFEGWYFKVINKSGSKAFAFIPGIAMDAKGNKQAFIQVLDGIKKTAAYHQFAHTDFNPTPGRFFLNILGNSFSESHLKLQLGAIQGELIFTGNVPWPKPFYSPGIMGPFAFVPFLECYHGIVSMNHHINGSLVIDGEIIDFTGGKGYIEKDWGRSFPSSYIWMQTNHFSQEGISLKASVAKIPWLGSSFVGFISGLWLHDRLIQFTTYNGTKLRKCFADKSTVELVMENKKHRLEIHAKRDGTTALASPILGLMDGRIEESMTSEIEIQLYDKLGKKLMFSGVGKHTALEVAGEISEILTDSSPFTSRESDGKK